MSTRGCARCARRDALGEAFRSRACCAAVRPPLCSLIICKGTIHRTCVFPSSQLLPSSYLCILGLCAQVVCGVVRWGCACIVCSPGSKSCVLRTAQGFCIVQDCHSTLSVAQGFRPLCEINFVSSVKCNRFLLGLYPYLGPE